MKTTYQILALIAVVVLAAADVRASQSDPPGRVGRIGYLSGPVTLTDLQDGDDEPATLNWPLTSQHRMSTGHVGRAEVRIGSTAVRLDGDTVVDFSRIDDEVIQFVVQRGSVALRIRNRDKLREIDVLTPRERINFEDTGRYRIDVDRPAGISAVTASVGYARIGTGSMSFVVQSGQRGEVTASPHASFQLINAAHDSFDDWVIARDRRDDTVRSARYVSPETTGIESLDEHGYWRQVDSYGAIWYPTHVASGWAPYRYGRWTYVAPWGWTWIDDSPWGFAPFHYGRWHFVGGAWGWVPGVFVSRPVYAPALVAWYGSSGVSVSVSVGHPVGWFPLGPGEVYIPAYYHSPRYITHVNSGYYTNTSPSYRYRRPDYSTWVSGDTLTRRAPVQRFVQAAPNEWVKLPTAPQPPVRGPGDGRKFKMESTTSAGASTTTQIQPTQPGRAVVGNSIVKSRGSETIVRPPTFAAPPSAAQPPPTVASPPARSIAQPGNNDRARAPIVRAPREDIVRSPRVQTPEAHVPRPPQAIAAPPAVRAPQPVEAPRVESQAPLPRARAQSVEPLVGGRDAPPTRANDTARHQSRVSPGMREQ